MVMIQVHKESAQDAEKRQSSPSSGKREGYFNREHTWIGWVTVVVLILLWELLYRTGALPATSFPSAFDTFGRLFQLFGTGAFWVSVGLTMQGVVAGLGLVILIALPVGVAIGVSRFVRESTWLLIEFLKPIPPVALIPIGLLFWGPSMGMKTSLIVFGAIWPLLVQVIYGVRAVDNVVLRMARSYRLGWWMTISRVVMPSILPYVITGLKISTAIAVVVAIVVELIGGAPGLGQSISIAQSSNALVEMYALIIAAGLLGLLINAVFALAERPLLYWHPSQRDKNTGKEG